MSKATEPASVRRLVGLFTNSVASTTNTSGTAAATAAAAVVTPSKSTAKARRLQNIAKRFKKSSESYKFRNNDKKTYANTVHRLASAKQFSLIDDIFQHQKKYKEISEEGFVIRLITLYGRAGMFEHAQKLFDEMPELKCKRTVKSVNALLAACVHSKKFDKVGKLLEQLPKEVGIEPNLISYNTIINALCQMGSMDSALSVLDTLEKKGLEPNIVTFNTLLDRLFSEGRIADGEEIWRLMERKNVIPDTWSYNSKLKGFIHKNHNNKMLEAVELLEEMKSKGTEPDVRSYNTLIKGYCRNGDLEQVKKWYGELRRNFFPDQVTYLTLVPFLCKKNEFEMAIELFKEAIDQRVLPMTALIDRLVQQSMIEEAIQLIELGKSRFDLKLKLPRGIRQAMNKMAQVVEFGT